MSGSVKSDWFNSSQLVSYFPTIPPSAPERCVTYSREVQGAPKTALFGVLVDGKECKKKVTLTRHRERHQVGLTNRWRLPETLLSDCLGTTQAHKASAQDGIPYHKTLIKILTADNPRHSINMDLEVPYSERSVNLSNRPYTTPAAADMPQRLGSLPPPPSVKLTILPYNVPASSTKKRTLLSSKCMSTTTRFSQPLDVYNYYAKRNMSSSHDAERIRVRAQDYILLDCLDITWELHRPYAERSKTLARLIYSAKDEGPKKLYRSKVLEDVNTFVNSSGFYSDEYQEMTKRLSICDDAGRTKKEKSRTTHIHLTIDDPHITKQALAVALGNLYHDNIDVNVDDLAAVIAAACQLKFGKLIEGCTDLMLRNMATSTICQYYDVAHYYGLDTIIAACRRWLELNLVPQLSAQIELRHLPKELLETVLKSNRIFSYNEYWVYRTVAYWIFLQLNPQMRLMPSYSTVLTYFNSLPKASALIEREEGLDFTSLFTHLRLHGITDTRNMQDVQTMNIIPQSWVVKVLTDHYHALQGGGDMSLMTDFNTGSIRQGFVLDDEPHYHSEILSLHGFHFELKASKQKDFVYSFYMQRLKPGDPVLSFRQSERQTFSMRPDRDVRYSIRVQYVDERNQYQTVATGMLSQKFGLGLNTSKSEVLSVKCLSPPLYATFCILFPPS